MDISAEQIEALAPDQKSLTAASRLASVSKWLELCEGEDGLIWGSCQGSGAKAYRTVANASDFWYKCTCPSRKFPCKHALALFWLYSKDPSQFTKGHDAPEWVVEAVQKRRKKTPAEDSEKAAKNSAKKKSSKSKKKSTKKSSAASREATESSALEAAQELESWIGDQLRSGLNPLLQDPIKQCRRIGPRLVDFKASALASRVDELPAQLLDLPETDRLNLLISELSKWVLLCRAFRAQPKDKALKREITRAENREELLADPKATRLRSQWEVLGTQTKTRRSGLVQRSTWLLNLDASQKARTALLLDYHPAKSRRSKPTFTSAEQFEAELCFYPGPELRRAVIVEREESASLQEAKQPLPQGVTDPLAPWSQRLAHCPWSEEVLLQLGPGRLLNHDSQGWWICQSGHATLPLQQSATLAQQALQFDGLWGIWNGYRLDPIRLMESTESNA